MSSKRSSVITIPEFVAKPIGAHKALHAAFDGRVSDDETINTLSKRLWMLEIHRRLEAEARRTLTPDDHFRM